ncbi:NAD-dependent epimerase/dehydratase family protein [Mycolicibacterium bacteremicum]|uniref:NAD-dependent epimerase/dehydratase family protein n=1 Tax=Mycolicibacterium bacteremicum TaxID=564198 RepID=UPI0026EB76FF|nr:NAD-dependent epimerase/dehydratase family protein [Mycolicibacterium bacteremicum]
MSQDIHVVIGASGATGSVIVRELHKAGRRVRAVNRSGRTSVPGGVEFVGADATDPAQMREVCTGAAVVYNCVNPPFLQWRDAFPAVVDGVLAGAAEAGATLVHADNTWMYGKVAAPMTEATPYRPVSNLGVLRAWLADRILAAHQRGEVQAVIGRAGELFGPRVESTMGRNVFGAAQRGRTVHWLGAVDVPLTPLYIDDFAHGLITLGERKEALGQVWHVPHPEPVTARQFVGMITAVAGQPVRIMAHGSRTARALGVVSAIARAGAEMIYQFEQPFVVDGSRFARTFGEKPTEYDDAIRSTLDWYRANPGALRLGR